MPDNPEHKSYCFDLLTDYGFKYYWTDVAYELDKFGDDLLFDNQEELESEVTSHDFQRFFYANSPADYARACRVAVKNTATVAAPTSSISTRVLMPRCRRNRV